MTPTDTVLSPTEPAPPPGLLAEPTFEECLAEGQRFYDDLSAGRINLDGIPDTHHIAYYGGESWGTTRTGTPSNSGPRPPWGFTTPGCTSPTRGCGSRGEAVPSFDLRTLPVPVVGLPPDGDLPLAPPVPGLGRVLLRRLACWFRAPPHPGAVDAILDTGAPLHSSRIRLWDQRFRWRAGRDYDELSVAGSARTYGGVPAAGVHVPAGPAPGPGRTRRGRPGWGPAPSGRARLPARRPGRAAVHPPWAVGQRPGRPEPADRAAVGG